jgi:hypothetical protein
MISVDVLVPVYGVSKETLCDTLYSALQSWLFLTVPSPSKGLNWPSTLVTIRGSMYFHSHALA